MLKVSYGEGFFVTPVMSDRSKVERLQDELMKLPQYEPETKHTFHGGMYCREVFRHADVTVVGKVHKKEHFYFIVSGTVLITTDDGVMEVTGPKLICSKPGTKRAVYSLTDALCMTFHVVNATSVEEAEAELVEEDPVSMFTIGNKLKVKEIS
jgi:mannose-6-phosphate isomerase-like protein (cupin superfamily)